MENPYVYMEKNSWPNFCSDHDTWEVLGLEHLAG